MDIQPKETLVGASLVPRRGEPGNEARLVPWCTSMHVEVLLVVALCFWFSEH